MEVGSVHSGWAMWMEALKHPSFYWVEVILAQIQSISAKQLVMEQSLAMASVFGASPHTHRDGSSSGEAWNWYSLLHILETIFKETKSHTKGCRRLNLLQLSDYAFVTLQKSRDHENLLLGSLRAVVWSPCKKGRRICEAYALVALKQTGL